jgi:putative inorganic carbon (HCO3(-)) transporter
LSFALNISVITVAPIFLTILGFDGAYILNFKEADFEEESSK